MSTLRKREFHDCDLPTVPDPLAQYLWTCDACGSDWEWVAGFPYKEVIRSRFLLRDKGSRMVMLGGRWNAVRRTSEWKPVTG